MKIVKQKIKGPKHYDHDLGKYVEGKRPGLNRVQCVQVPVADLSKEQLRHLPESKGGPRHARRILERAHLGGHRLGQRRGTVANIPSA